MPAGAPYGNKNAEKWSFKKAVKLYNESIKLTNNIITYYLKLGEKAIEVNGYEFDFIGEIAAKLGTYHMLITRDLPNRFPTLQRLKNQLINNLERNCYSNTKKGIIKEATGIVNLKSNHHWTDRQDLTSKDNEVQPNQVNFTDEQVKMLIHGLRPEKT
jgi:hypothetical protein